VGIVVLLSGGKDGTMAAQPAEALAGSLAITGSAFMIAACAVFANRLPGHPSVEQITLTQLVVALPVLLSGAVLLEGPEVGLIRTPQTITTLAIIGWMGILGAGLANLLFYSLLAVWGVTRTSLITYLMPVIGVTLGIVLLGETLDVRLVIATSLVVSGIAAVHASSTTTKRRAPLDDASELHKEAQ
jgi:drug/metabolite transporter (DMT)-like permease